MATLVFVFKDILTPKIDFHGDLDIFNVIYSKYDDNISFFHSYMGLRCDERIFQEKK